MLRALLASLALFCATAPAVAGTADEGRQRIAVMPFHVDGAAFRLADHGTATVFSRRLADKLVSQLAGEPGVVLINRDFLAGPGREKSLLQTDVAPGELARIGAETGADFLLVGRIDEARTEVVPGPYGTREVKTDEIRLSWRLVGATDGKVLRAGDIAFDNVRKSKKPYSARDDFERNVLYTALAKHVAAAALGREAAAPAATAPAEPAPAVDTPGSSEAPLRW